MTQLIAIDPAALQSVLAELRQIRQRLDAVDMQPRPEWVTVADKAWLRASTLAAARRKARQQAFAGVSGPWATVCQQRARMGLT